MTRKSSAYDLFSAWARSSDPTFTAGARSASVYVQNGIAYSYGPHYPLARKINALRALVNVDGYSATTSRHICHVRRALSDAGFIVHDVSKADILAP